MFNSALYVFIAKSLSLEIFQFISASDSEHEFLPDIFSFKRIQQYNRKTTVELWDLKNTEVEFRGLLLWFDM